MSKGVVYMMIFIGGSIGGYLPVLLLHVSMFSVWSIVGTFIGSIAAVVIAYRLMQA